MRLLDLFTGTGSVKFVAESLGYEVTSLDIDPRCNPDVVADITLFDYTVWSHGEFDIVWASPPCETFSCARKCNIGRMVKGEMMTQETLLRDTESTGAATDAGNYFFHRLFFTLSSSRCASAYVPATVFTLRMVNALGAFFSLVWKA